jgi:hypothetical protein
MHSQILAVEPRRSLFPRAPSRFRAKLHRGTIIAPDTKHLEWDIVDSPPLQFRAAQFISALIQTGVRTEIRRLFGQMLRQIWALPMPSG